MSKTPGLNLPYGIDPVNPVPVDSNYGPYASLAQAKSSIPLGLRYDGLTVQITGSGNYWWLAADLTDTGLIAKTAGGGGATVVSITRAALQALVSGSTVSPGTVYSITDAQDALGGTVTMKGVTINTLDGNGTWNFSAKNGSSIRFILNGSAGSVNQLAFTRTTGGTVNLLPSPVAYTTSLVNTNNLVAAAVNAGTGTHGVRALVINNSSIDKAQLVLTEVDGVTNVTPALVVTATTLTTTSQTVVDRSVTTRAMSLVSFYDITNDRILSATDVNNSVTVACSIKGMLSGL